MDPKLNQLYAKFQQLNIMHVFLSCKGLSMTTSMLSKLNITALDVAFFVGLEIIKLKEDEIIFSVSKFNKRKKNFKEQVIMHRNDQFLAKIKNANVDVDIFIESTIECGSLSLFSGDFFINFKSSSRMLELLRQVKQQSFYIDQIVAVKSTDAVEPSYSECALHPRLNHALKAKGIFNLYSHQVEAITNIRNNKSTIVSTTTASGKSLIFQIPTIEMLLDDPTSSFLYLFPTKALSNDQLLNIQNLSSLLELDAIANTYDGDTPKDIRPLVRNNTQIVFTNPDMLHCSILPNHEKWHLFLSNLKYVILDECHVYQGLFGNHMIFILKRLQRICASHNNPNVLFLGFSATISNPQEHFSTLISKPVVAVTNDGSPCHSRHLILWNPPLIHSCRLPGISQASHLAIFLCRRKIKVLIFTLYRQQTEQLLHEIHKLLEEQGFLKFTKYFKSYRGGYQPHQRRQIEREFKNSDIYCVVSTNALELGMDIGDIDVVLHLSFPGIDSYIQQLGRGGRVNDAMSILIANGNQVVDQYWMNHSDLFFNLKSSPISLDVSEQPILQYKHVACASMELPLSVQDYKSFISTENEEYSDFLILDNKQYFYNRNVFIDGPHSHINIRGSAQESTFRIFNKHTNELLEEIELYRAFFTLYPGCIFMHMGKPYIIHDVDQINMNAFVIKSNVDYYTKVDDVVDVDPKEHLMIYDDLIKTGSVLLTCKIYGYSKYDLSSNRLLESFEREPMTMKRHLNGCWLEIPQYIVQIINKNDEQLIYHSMHAVNHGILKLLPTIINTQGLVQCECRGEHAIRQRPAQLMLFENEQSAGYCKTIGSKLKALLSSVYELLMNCDCEDGCIKCIQHEQCRTRNGSLNKAGGIELLKLLVNELI